jgi:hypothetical protein
MIIVWYIIRNYRIMNIGLTLSFPHEEKYVPSPFIANRRTHSVCFEKFCTQ